MARKRCTGKALAERRRCMFNFYVAGFTQEEIAEKVGVNPSVVCRDLQAFRDSICPGESPDVQEACFIQMERMIFDPQPGQFDPCHPPLAGTSGPEDAAASWEGERNILDPKIHGYGPQLKL
ncbi:MAG: hypothetical protein ACLQNE_17245 [Thermoguttaceae bacterium]